MKIKAFTLLEVTIAMLLAAITIGICYTAFTLMNQYYADIKNRKDQVGEILLLQKLLRKDVERATLIKKLADGVYITYDTVNISYHFSADYITRDYHQIKTDTIKIATATLDLKFENREVANDGLLDEIIFTCKQKGKRFPMHFKKTYSATNLFQ